MKISSRLTVLRAAVLLSLAAFSAVNAQGATYSWNVTSGTWATANNWSPKKTPTSADNAYVANGGTATVSSSGAACNDLYLGDANSTKAGTVQMSGGNFSVTDSVYIGNNTGRGTFIQNGGSNNVTNNVYLAFGASSTGSYTVGNSASLSAGTLCVGNDGAGSFTHANGSVNVGDIYLAFNAGSSGSYTISNSASLVANTLYVGNGGAGVFTHANASVNVGDMVVANNAGSSGTCSVSGAAVLSAASEVVGESGSGVFNQTGGANNITPYAFTGTLVLADALGSKGTYSLSGSGALTAQQETIGINGKGQFIQSGGTNSVMEQDGFTAALQIGGGTVGSSYSLSNSGLVTMPGTSNRTGEYISQNGSFNQTGGTNAMTGTSRLEIDSGGSYSLSGAAVLSAGNMVLASGGRYSQSNGTNTVFNEFQLNGGTCNVTGGVLCLPNIDGDGTGVFNLGGASLAANASFSTTQTITLTGLGGNGIIAPNGNTVAFSGNVTGPGGLTLAGSGELDLSGPNDYAGGTIVSGGTLGIADPSSLGAGSFNLGGATLLAKASFSTSQTITLTGLGGNGIVAPNGNTIGFTGNVTGPGGLTLAGSGELDLSGTNDYAGGTIVSGGTLGIADPSSLGTGSFNLGGATLLAKASFSTSQTITLTGLGGNGIVAPNGNTVAFSGNVTGPGGLTLAGSGELDLSGTNDYAGGTIVSGGTLGIADPSSLGTGSFNLGGATLLAKASFSTTQTITLTGLGGNGIIAPNGNTVAFSGNVTGPGGLTLAGSGELDLSGTNDYAGGTIVRGGTLRIADPSSLRDGSSLTVGDPTAFSSSAVVPAGIAPVPEPAAAAIVATCAALIATYFFARRKIIEARP